MLVDISHKRGFVIGWKKKKKKKRMTYVAGLHKHSGDVVFCWSINWPNHFLIALRRVALFASSLRDAPELLPPLRDLPSCLRGTPVGAEQLGKSQVCPVRPASSTTKVTWWASVELLSAGYSQPCVQQWLSAAYYVAPLYSDSMGTVKDVLLNTWGDETLRIKMTC